MTASLVSISTQKTLEAMILVNIVVRFVVYSQLALCLFEKLPTHILFECIFEIHKQEESKLYKVGWFTHWPTCIHFVLGSRSTAVQTDTDTPLFLSFFFDSRHPSISIHVRNEPLMK